MAFKIDVISKEELCIYLQKYSEELENGKVKLNIIVDKIDEIFYDLDEKKIISYCQKYFFEGSTVFFALLEKDINKYYFYLGDFGYKVTTCRLTNIVNDSKILLSENVVKNWLNELIKECNEIGDLTFRSFSSRGKYYRIYEGRPFDILNNYESIKALLSKGEISAQVLIGIYEKLPHIYYEIDNPVMRKECWLKINSNKVYSTIDLLINTTNCPSQILRKIVEAQFCNYKTKKGVFEHGNCPNDIKELLLLDSTFVKYLEEQNVVTKDNPIEEDKRCFIATVCYEDINHDSVLVLRKFRDEVLLRNKIGIVLVRFYYKLSIKVLPIIKSNEGIKKHVKYILDFIVLKIR